ncbi:MAG: XRE family transcriptional regulator [Prolixibacteraceae bacterium]|nr:XRE family transcriptional regulator [Burkholderiales bacterium]
MKLTALAERTGNWWAIEVPEVPGLFTQVKRLGQVDAMVRDAAAALIGEPEDSFDVDIQPQIPETVAELIDHAKQLTEEAGKVQRNASMETKKAATLLQQEGMTVRDIGVVMGVSYQRISQILAD